MEVLLSRQNGAPGGLATSAVGEGTDHPIAQAIVVTHPLLTPEHSCCRTSGAQLLLGLFPATESGDASIELTRLVKPATLGISLDGGNPNPEIHQGRTGHGHHVGEKCIASRQGAGINAASTTGQFIDQRPKRQAETHNLFKASTPRFRTDVLKVDREYTPVRCQRLKGQIVIVEAEASAAKRISPAQHQITAVALGHDQLVLDCDLGVVVALLGSR